jgi:hypothetical protein
MMSIDDDIRKRTVSPDYISLEWYGSIGLGKNM